MQNYDFTVKVAFIELYKELLYDLLSTQVCLFLSYNQINFEVTKCTTVTFLAFHLGTLIHF